MRKKYSVMASAYCGFIGFVLYSANTSGFSPGLQLLRTINHGDKVAHFILFGVLSLVLNLALEVRRVGFGRCRIYHGTVIVGVFMVVEEFSQKYIPSRNFDYADLVADFAGLVVFAGITRFLAVRQRVTSSRL